MVTTYFTFFLMKNMTSPEEKKKKNKSHYPFQVYSLVASLSYVLEVPSLSQEYRDRRAIAQPLCILRRIARSERGMLQERQ